MPCTRDVAIDEITARIVPVLAAIPTKWPNGPEPVRTDDSLWARVSFRNADSGRSSIGVRRETHDSFLYVQYFFPTGSGSTLIYSVPQLMLNALVDYKTPSGVWFRKVTLLDGNADDTEDVSGYFPMTIQAQFTFDEVRK